MRFASSAPTFLLRGLPWAVLAFLVSGGPVRADTADVEEIQAAVSSFHAALSAGDVPAVEGLLASDAVVIEEGVIQSRDEYLSHHLAADMEFTRALPGSRGPARTWVEGRAGWVLTTHQIDGEFEGKGVHIAVAELVVLSRREGQWQIRAIHWSSRSLPR